MQEISADLHRILFHFKHGDRRSFYAAVVVNMLTIVLVLIALAWRLLDLKRHQDKNWGWRQEFPGAKVLYAKHRRISYLRFEGLYGEVLKALLFFPPNQ